MDFKIKYSKNPQFPTDQDIVVLDDAGKEIIRKPLRLLNLPELLLGIADTLAQIDKESKRR